MQLTSLQAQIRLTHLINQNAQCPPSSMNGS
jgi:hypothetical protein